MATLTPLEIENPVDEIPAISEALTEINPEDPEITEAAIGNDYNNLDNI